MTLNAETYVPSAEFAERARLNEDLYNQMYLESITDPDAFWRRHGQRLEWIKLFTKVQDTSFREDLHIKWFEDGLLNASVNCLDRHLATCGDKAALIWEGDEPGESKTVNFSQA